LLNIEMRRSFLLVGFAAALTLVAYLLLRGNPIEKSLPAATESSPEPSVDSLSAAQRPTESTAVPPVITAPTESAASRFRSLRQCFHAAAKKTVSECGDVADIERRYYEATRAAAKAGDPDAQLCYLAFDFSLQSHLTPIAGAELAEYAEVSPTYVEAAIKRGDWRIAYLLTRRSGPVTRLNQGGRPEIVYRMTRLLRHGARGDFAKFLDYKLNSLAHPDLKPEAALPAKVMKEGDAWAQEIYNTYYSGVPGITEPPTICDR
jgi:hypothetical protein